MLARGRRSCWSPVCLTLWVESPRAAIEATTATCGGRAAARQGPADSSWCWQTVSPAHRPAHPGLQHRQHTRRVSCSTALVTRGSREPCRGRARRRSRPAGLIGTFAGDFYRPGSTCSAFLFQTFLVSRIFKYIGVRGALFILPLIALGSYAALALFPMLRASSGWPKMLENGTDYSIQNTARHALFLPTSREAKYKAKQAIDSFFLRAGDLLQAVVVFVGVRLAFDVRALRRWSTWCSWPSGWWSSSRSRANTRSWFRPKPSKMRPEPHSCSPSPRWPCSLWLCRRLRRRRQSRAEALRQQRAEKAAVADAVQAQRSRSGDHARRGQGDRRAWARGPLSEARKPHDRQRLRVRRRLSEQSGVQAITAPWMCGPPVP